MGKLDEAGQKEGKDKGEAYADEMGGKMVAAEGVHTQVAVDNDRDLAGEQEPPTGAQTICAPPPRFIFGRI